MTRSRLDIDGRVVGRRAEMTELRAAVEAAGRAGGGCVLLSGVPGVGKSALVHAFGAEISRRNCVFAYGRCRDGAPAPYSALRDALSSIVRTMEATGLAERDRWRASVISETSALAGVLSELVPDLANVLGGETGRPAALDAADARRRLHRGAIRLVSETATYRPVVLAIDDLQWADGDTLMLLSELLTVSHRNVLVIGVHRAGEFDAESAGLRSAELRGIELGPLTRGDLEDLLAAVSGRGVELADVAAEFHHRTEGNALQVRQLLYRAQREGALTPIGPSGQPSWDLRILSSIEITPTSAEFIGRYLDQLSATDREVLASLSCIGGEFDLADATTAAARPPDVVAHALWASLELRLLEALDDHGQRIANAISRDGRYRFSHDRVAEAAREGLSADAQRETHLRIGRRLVGLGDDRLFEAARHVGIGGRGLPDDDERIRFVEVLRYAARKARAQASFPLALAYCRSGVGLLGARGWAEHYPMMRELHLDAADAALLVGDAKVLQELLDEAERFLPSPTDRARLAYLRLKGKVAENRLQDALDMGLRALDDLGEPLARYPGKPRMAVALVRMKFAMSRWTTERLLRLAPCEDPLVIEIQRILAELRSLSYIVRPNINPLVVAKQLDLVLAHGHTPSSPLVLVSYGLLLVMLGDRAGSQRFGEVAMQLARRPEYAEARPQTSFMYLNFVHHWRHPIRDGLGQLRDAITEALDQGDQEYAGWLSAVVIGQSFFTGRPLAEIDALARSLTPEIRSQPAPLACCQATHQFCLNLMGRSEDPLLLAGESGYDERVVLPAARDEGDEVALSTVATQKLGLYFWSGDYTGAMGVMDEAIEHVGGMAGTAFTPLIYLTSAVSAIHAAPKARSTSRLVRRAVALHRKWAEDAPANYAAPCALIEGTWARCRGAHGTAERFLHRAIELADEHQLPLIGALAHEEAAALYAQTGRTMLREHMLRAAYKRFLSQGVVLRTNRLARADPWLLSRDLVQQGAAEFDPVGAHDLVRALGAARTPEDLAAFVLGTVVDTTGASRALFLTCEADHLGVRAVHERGDTTTVDGPWSEVPYDRAVVDRVLESGTPLIVTAPSVLAVPIIVQGNAIGIVYAEQDLPGRYFAADQEEAVAFLCDQTAAPLWNFQLEARLRAADEYRRSLMDVQSRFVPNELLRILDIDDLRRVRSGYRVEREMTVLISDIRGYSTMIEDMNVSEASNLAMGFLRAVEMPIISCNGMIQDVRGDEIVAVFESEVDAVRAGLAMLRSLREHNRERMALGSEELRAGIGINTGALGVGLVGGVNRMVLTIIGDAVNLAARIESTNKRYGSALLVSDVTRDRLVGRGHFDIRRMERVMVVNRKRPVTIYEVYDDDSAELRLAKRSAQSAFDEAFALFDAGDVDQARSAFERCSTLLPDDPVAPLHLGHCDAVTRGEMTAGQEVLLRQK